MRENRCPWRGTEPISAESGGHFDVLKWCVGKGCPWGSLPRNSEGAFEASVAMMIWTKKNDSPWMLHNIEFAKLCCISAGVGNLKVLLWYRTFRPRPQHLQGFNGGSQERACAHSGKASSGGQPFKAFETSPKSKLCRRVIVSGSLETLQWCTEMDLPWNPQTW